jgi:hypothetical protein
MKCGVICLQKLTKIKPEFQVFNTWPYYQIELYVKNLCAEIENIELIIDDDKGSKLGKLIQGFGEVPKNKKGKRNDTDS